MEIKGFVERGVHRNQDYRRFVDLLGRSPYEVAKDEINMMSSVRRLAELAQPTNETIRGKNTGDLRFATPWICETRVPDSELVASMRLAHNRYPDLSQSIWHGIIQLRVAQPSSEETRLDMVDIVAEFTGYERENSLVMDIATEFDFGQPGSESWDQLQELLGEATAELSAAVPTA